jgi:hypothetical protein
MRKSMPSLRMTSIQAKEIFVVALCSLKENKLLKTQQYFVSLKIDNFPAKFAANVTLSPENVKSRETKKKAISKDKRRF